MHENEIFSVKIIEPYYHEISFNQGKVYQLFFRISLILLQTRSQQVCWSLELELEVK